MRLACVLLRRRRRLYLNWISISRCIKYNRRCQKLFLVDGGALGFAPDWLRKRVRQWVCRLAKQCNKSAQLASPLATVRHLDLLIDISLKGNSQALRPITSWVFHYLNKCLLWAPHPVHARVRHQTCRLAALPSRLEAHMSRPFTFRFASYLQLHPPLLDLPLIASMSLSVLKSNPIRYTYVTVPATAIVVRVRLTLSAVIRAISACRGADSCASNFSKCTLLLPSSSSSSSLLMSSAGLNLAARLPEWQSRQFIQISERFLRRSRERNKTKQQKKTPFLRLLVSTMSLIYVDRMRKLPWSERYEIELGV